MPYELFANAALPPAFSPMIFPVTIVLLAPTPRMTKPVPELPLTRLLTTCALALLSIKTPDSPRFGRAIVPSGRYQ